MESVAESFLMREAQCLRSMVTKPTVHTSTKVRGPAITVPGKFCRSGVAEALRANQMRESPEYGRTALRIPFN
jgi:hypothetical protein